VNKDFFIANNIISDQIIVYWPEMSVISIWETGWIYIFWSRSWVTAAQFRAPVNNVTSMKLVYTRFGISWCE